MTASSPKPMPGMSVDSVTRAGLASEAVLCRGRVHVVPWSPMTVRSPAVLLATALLLGVGCAVKPPLRYVAPDGTLHDVVVEPQRTRQRPPATVPDAQGDAPDAPRPPEAAQPADEARAHYSTAVGLQAACRYGEALSHLRGYLEVEPEGELAGRAMVRMAEIYREPAFAGRDEERARALLSEVVGRFPGSTAAALACQMAPELCTP